MSKREELGEPRFVGALETSRAARHENDQRTIESWAVWPVLQGKLWHATSVERSASIIAEGVIRTDTSAHRRSHCHKMGCVSLLDFSEPVEKIAVQLSNWQGWFGYQAHIRGKASVWFRVDRQAVNGSVKTVRETNEEWAAHGHSQYIPHVEVCHRGSLPLRAIIGALVISREDRSRFEMISPGPQWQTQIEAYAATLPDLPPPPPLEAAIRAAEKEYEIPPN